ncbi:MAG: MaoC family dehydratase [Syntrophomonadaceae bacterium]|nr:MaoC family dehydratase [Syntrophomonadaceae bacterium]
MGKSVEELNIGDKASFTKTITQYDVLSFAGVSGDFNPSHTDAQWASSSTFGQVIGHAVLNMGFISNVLGTQLPGPGVIYVRQSIKYKRPIFVDDTITAMVEVTRKDEAKNRVWLHTWTINQNGDVVSDGEAIMMPPRKSK